AERYANNPNYKHSYEAEQTLSGAMQSCSELIEFKDKMGNLNDKCANALIKDKYIMDQAFFNEMLEKVRVLASNRILEKVDNYEKVLDLITMVTDEENTNSIEISMDEAHRELVHAWKLLDDIEIYEKAEIPAQYKADHENSVVEFKQSLNKSVTHLEENNSHWQAGWRLKPELITEHRHRRLLPYKDEHVIEQLQKYKSFVNR
ncbi:MAG: hypothetical protein KKD31_03120, partial [Bacteroidetes bacterium]|nr:hypothetical protein [Bacteroidota bacterium]